MSPVALRRPIALVAAAALVAACAGNDGSEVPDGERHMICGHALAWQEHRAAEKKSSSPRPQVVAGIDDAVEVDVGGVGCVRRAEGTVSCWVDANTPPLDLPFSEPVRSIDVGTSATCATHGESVSCFHHEGIRAGALAHAIARVATVRNAADVCVQRLPDGGEGSWQVRRNAWACVRAGAEGAVCWDVLATGRNDGATRVEARHDHGVAPDTSEPCPPPPDASSAKLTEAKKLYTQAMLHVELGELDEARPLLEAAYELAPKYQLLKSLGDLAATRGNDQAAVAAYRQFLKCGGEAILPDARKQVLSRLEQLDAEAARDPRGSSSGACPWPPDNLTTCFGTDESLAGRAPQGALSVSVGTTHACAIMPEGKVSCWGRNSMGELGDGSYDDRPQPVVVTELTDAVQVSAGDRRTCAVRRTGGVVCWGIGAVPAPSPPSGAIRL